MVKRLEFELKKPSIVRHQRVRCKPIFVGHHALTVITALTLAGLCTNRAVAETCTTQSQMAPGDKDAIVSTVRRFAALVQANDDSGLRAQTLPEYAKDPAAMAALVSNTAPKVQGAELAVDQVYLLDATSLKTLGDGTNQDAQFFCSLNKSIAESEFLIPSLPPGKYAFAVVATRNGTQSKKAPWEMSFLLRQDQGGHQWSMAGFYPKPLTAAGHDGLWYWTQARELVKAKQLWSGYLYYQEAQSLLQPVVFLSSTHLDKLRKETSSSAPAALSDGISVDAPLVVKGPAGVEYRFTALTTDDSLGADKVDVLVHLQDDPAAEPVPGGATKSDAAKKLPPTMQPRERNSLAMSALVAAFPELRANFHGVWVFAEASGKPPFATEEPMANIH